MNEAKKQICHSPRDRAHKRKHDFKAWKMKLYYRQNLKKKLCTIPLELSPCVWKTKVKTPYFSAPNAPSHFSDFCHRRHLQLLSHQGWKNTSCATRGLMNTRHFLYLQPRTVTCCFVCTEREFMEASFSILTGIATPYKLYLYAMCFPKSFEEATRKITNPMCTKLSCSTLHSKPALPDFYLAVSHHYLAVILHYQV